MSELLSGTEAWFDYLKDRALPVRNSVLRRLQRQLLDDQIPLQRINKTIKSDPVLSLHMVRKAAALHLEKNSKVTTIDHAISSLGLDHINTVIESTTPLKLNPSSVSQKMYFRQIAISHHAATQAKQWLKSRKAPFLDETYLATIFYGVGNWMLWQHAPLHMSEIECLIREKNIEPNTAEQTVLGCSIEEISQKLVIYWGISELAATSLDIENTPDRKVLTQLHRRALGDPRLSTDDLREINHLAQAKYFPVKLANWLALAASYGWQLTRTMKIIDIVNDLQKGEIAETIAQLHRNCVSSAQHYFVAGTISPATELLMIPSDKHINYKLSRKEQAIVGKSAPAYIPQPEENESSSTNNKTQTEAGTEQKAQPNTTKGDDKLFETITDRFLKGYKPYTQPKNILQALIQAISQGLGLERTALFLVNTSQEQLKTGLQIGFGKTHDINRFSLSLNEKTIFKKLVIKQTSLVAKPDNLKLLSPLLPEDFKAWINPNGFMLVSIFKKQKPVAILYIDQGKSGEELSEPLLERINFVCTSATIAMKKLAK